MKLPVFVVAAACILAVACKKSETAAPPPDVNTNEPRTVRLQLSGDILTSESPLPNGRQKEHTANNARTLRDSTVYAVLVKRVGDNSIFLRALYNRPDSVFIELPASGDVVITAVAYKRGTGPGLFYTWQNGQPYYESPFNSIIKNKTDTIAYYDWYTTDSIAHMTLFDALDSTRYRFSEYPELDAYRGTDTVNVADAPPTISLAMKRLAFGIQFSASNFTEGKLIAEFPDYSNVMVTKTVTPANIATQYFIHSSDLFKRFEAMTYGLTVRMKWEKPDGTVTALGEKRVSFKRNVLTNIHVTLPSNGRVVGIDITENNWSNTEVVNF